MAASFWEEAPILNEPTAPTCIVIACEELSALASVAMDQFFSFTTYFCGMHYEQLLAGGDVQIHASRIIIERVSTSSDAE